MADLPELVTHGFSLNDSALAFLMLQGEKIIENRNFRFLPGFYAVGITKTAYTPVEREFELKNDFPNLPLSVDCKTRGQIIGLVRIGYALPSTACATNRWCANGYKVCNIITHFLKFDTAVPASGNFGSWPLKGAESAVRRAAVEALAQHGGVVKSTRAEIELPPRIGETMQDQFFEQTKTNAEDEEVVLSKKKANAAAKATAKATAKTAKTIAKAAKVDKTTKTTKTAKTAAPPLTTDLVPPCP